LAKNKKVKIMRKRNYYRFNQDPWNDEIYKPAKKENDMVNEDENQVEETTVETPIHEQFGMTVDEWNASQSAWDVLHDQHGLRGLEGRF
jgi:hypothetical protein